MLVYIFLLMKRIYLFLIVIFAAMLGVCAAEGKNVVPSVEGVRVDRPLNRFTSSLVRKGLIVAGDTPDAMSLKGNVMGRDGGIVVVVPHEDHSLPPAAVGVFVAGGDDWKTLRSVFSKVVEFCREDYGDPVEQVSTFGKDGDLTDGERLAGLIQGVCDWHASWDLDQWLVEVSMEFSMGAFYVVERIICKDSLEQQ